MTTDLAPRLTDRALTMPETEHYVCACDENSALCGADVSAEPWSTYTTTDNDCVVCVELIRASLCDRCGLLL